MFDEEAEQLEARRYQFVRNLVRQQHGEGTGGLLKMAEKESQVVVVPTKVFEFAAISGIEGTFNLSIDLSSLMVVVTPTRALFHGAVRPNKCVSLRQFSSQSRSSHRV